MVLELETMIVSKMFASSEKDEITSGSFFIVVSEALLQLEIWFEIVQKYWSYPSVLF